MSSFHVAGHLPVVWLALLLLGPVAQGQRGARAALPPDRRNAGPGQGPSIPYQEEEWEFWWFLNHESALGLRERVRSSGDAVFAALTPADRDRIDSVLLQHAAPEHGTGIRTACLMGLAKAGAPGAAATLQEALRDEVHAVRMRAILGLGVLGDASQADLLRHVLQESGNDAERHRAGVSLGLLVDAHSFDPVRELLDPEAFAALSAPARRGLALGAGLTGESRLGPTILKLLEEGHGLSSTVRAYLVQALGRTGNGTGREHLLGTLEDSDSTLRRAAAIGLGSMAAGTADPVIAQALAERLEKESAAVSKNFLCIALGRVGGPVAARALMLQVIPKRSGAVRGGFVQPRVNLSDRSKGPYAALGLGMLDDLRGHDGLLRRFADSGDHSFQGALASALALTRHQRAIPELRKELQKTRDPVLRGHLALALGSLGDERSRGRLETMLRDDDDRELVPRLALALALIGHRDRAEDVLLNRLTKKKNSSAARRTFLYGLGLIGDRDCVAPLATVLSNQREPEAVREYAAIALGMIADPLPRRVIAQLNTDSHYTLESGLLGTLRAVH